jgi:hypothetical protein
MAKAIHLRKLTEDMQRWPKSWAGFDSDIPTGKGIVQVMRLFLVAMVADQFAYTSISRYMSNLWLLGGEIISRVHIEPELKDLDGKRLILRFVDEEGGPYSRHFATEEEQKAFNATCKKLYSFLIRRRRPKLAGRR